MHPKTLDLPGAPCWRGRGAAGSRRSTRPPQSRSRRPRAASASASWPRGQAAAAARATGNESGSGRGGRTTTAAGSGSAVMKDSVYVRLQSIIGWFCVNTYVMCFAIGRNVVCCNLLKFFQEWKKNELVPRCATLKTMLNLKSVIGADIHVIP